MKILNPTIMSDTYQMKTLNKQDVFLDVISCYVFYIRWRFGVMYSLHHQFKNWKCKPNFKNNSLKLACSVLCACSSALLMCSGLSELGYIYRGFQRKDCLREKIIQVDYITSVCVCERKVRLTLCIQKN